MATINNFTNSLYERGMFAQRRPTQYHCYSLEQEQHWYLFFIVKVFRICKSLLQCSHCCWCRRLHDRRFLNFYLNFKFLVWKSICIFNFFCLKIILFLIYHHFQFDFVSLQKYWSTKLNFSEGRLFILFEIFHHFRKDFSFCKPIKLFAIEEEGMKNNDIFYSNIISKIIIHIIFLNTKKKNIFLS